MSSQESNNSNSQGLKFTFDNFKSLLSMLVIPIALWGVKLEVSNAVMNQEIERLKVDVQKVNDIENTVQKNSVTLAQLRERIDAANATLQDIKDILRDRGAN